ncbi:MAG: VacJ family lipoprotein [Desulfurivibrionaceae bacterium]
MSVKAGSGNSKYGASVYVFFLALLVCCLAVGQVRAGVGTTVVPAEEDDSPEFADWEEDFPEDREMLTIRDPLEPANRMFFRFNDKLYFWFLKPVSKVYGDVVPRDFRISFRNAFNNILSPVSMANSFLQGDFKNGSVEGVRFFINSTVGILGMADAAEDVFGLDEGDDEDLGQTMGYYGIGHGLYLCWPVLGPSSLRDTVGMTGDLFFRPDTYILSGWSTVSGGALLLGKYVNNTSFNIGDYEDFLAATFDPYVAMQDAYLQRRHKMIKE